MLMISGFVITVAILVSAAVAQEPTQEAKIARALSAGPLSVAAKATVMEWPSRQVLRKGTNSYFCFPSLTSGYPACVEEPWLKWIQALSRREKPPAVTSVAIGYWLQGARAGSNEDPFATAKDMASHVKVSGEPHLAILVPDRSVLESLPTDPTQGGPWVMFKNTPYVHLMVPAPRPEEK